MGSCPNIFGSKQYVQRWIKWFTLWKRLIFYGDRYFLSRETMSAKGFTGRSALCLCSTVPVGDVGSLAIDPSLLMVLITKFFSRVKFVSPTLSELSITNTMSRAPQRFSQSETKDKNRISMLKDTNNKAVLVSSLYIQYYLTATTARLPDVSHDITVLQWHVSRLVVIKPIK